MNGPPITTAIASIHTLSLNIDVNLGRGGA
jgi:hypothetical protein